MMKESARYVTNENKIIETWIDDGEELIQNRNSVVPENCSNDFMNTCTLQYI